MTSLQNFLIFLLLFLHIHAKKPPGYVEPPKEYDPNPPKYEYGYRIQDEKGEQGKDEKRDGIYAKGRYYVQGKDSTQNVQYVADDWGYHPVVEYSSVGPHSRSRTNIILGQESIKQLKNKDNGLPTTSVGSYQPTNDLPNIEQNLVKTAPPTVPSDTSEKLTQNQPKQSENANPLPREEPIIIQPQQQQQQPIFLALQNEVQPSNQPVFIDQNLQQIFLPHPQPIHDSTAELSSQQNIYNQGVQYIYNHDTDQSRNQQDVFLINQHASPVLIQHNQNEIAQPFIIQPQPLIGHQHLGQAEYIQNQNGQELVLAQEGLILRQEDGSATNQKLQSQQIIHQDANKPDQQLVLLQEQNYPLNYQDQKVLYHTNIVNTEENAKSTVIDINNTENKEFGAKLQVKTSTNSAKNLIESTKDLISSQDVLNINKAALNEEIHQNHIESSTATAYISPTTITYSSTTPAPFSETSLLKKPIVVAEVQENFESSSSGNEHISISSTVKSVVEESVIVTPRPVSTKFLAPITAGIQLISQQNIEEKTEEAQEKVQYAPNKNVIVEVQQSVPYYLGKYEYPSGYAAEYSAEMEHKNKTEKIEYQVQQDLALGKTLLLLPTAQAQPLISTPPKTELTYLNHQPTNIETQHVVQHETHQVYEKEQENVSENTKIVENLLSTVHTYPNEVPQQVPVAESIPLYQIQVPNEQEETPIIDKSILVPQPYHIEKIVEKPVQVPYEVTKYIDNPYPVEVPVPYPQPYPVDRIIEKKVPVPYPVEKIVEKVVKQPYPVEVRVPYPQPVETVVEKKVPVPYEIEKVVQKVIKQPYPIPYRVPYPYAVPVTLEKNIPYYVNRPYPVQVPIKVPSPYVKVVNVEVPKYILKPKYASVVANGYFGNPYAYAPFTNQYLPPKQELKLNRGKVFSHNVNTKKGNSLKHNEYLPPPVESTLKNNEYLPPPLPVDQKENLDSSKNKNYQVAADSIQQNLYSPIKNDNYLGLLPPKYNHHNNGKKLQESFRSARSSFDEKSIRMEYGFMPPLIPSLEIDEHGQPIEKDKR